MLVHSTVLLQKYFAFSITTTHNLSFKPLDVVYFQTFKHYHAKAMENTVRMGDAGLYACGVSGSYSVKSGHSKDMF